MIELFEIRNFKSILDVKVELSYGEGSAPRHFQESENWAFLQAGNAKNERFVPVLAIYGANASGKSNIVHAFQNFQRVMSQGIGGCYFPNKLNARYDYAAFKVTVVLDGVRYVYEIQYDAEKIRAEKLVRLAHGANPEAVLFSLGAVNCFDGIVTAGYDAERMENALRIECRNGDGSLIKPFIVCVARTFPGLTDCIPKIVGEFVNRLQVSNRNEFFISQGVDLLAQFNTAEARKTAMGKIVRLLKKFDFGVKEMTMVRQRVGKGKEPFGGLGAVPRFSPVSITRDAGDAWEVDEFKLLHENADGELTPLDFMTEESDGTKVVAALIGVCLWALETGRTLFVDELDRSLHPFILISLIKLFKSKRYNKTNAQLVFTVHDPTALDEDMMRVSEIGIVDKTVKTGTSFRRLCDFEGARNVTNFRRQYLAGVYSGVPFPYI